MCMKDMNECERKNEKQKKRKRSSPIKREVQAGWRQGGGRVTG